MKEFFYCADRDFLEPYLKERASATIGDFKTAADIWGNKIPDPGSSAAVDEIYHLEGNTAHIKIEGPLSPEGPDAWDRLWGYNGTSYKTIQAAIERAKTDTIAARVVFDIDSPGGTLNGCDETWRAHKDLAAVKPTEARAGNLLASAAYEIASPSRKILASSPSSRIGSIGVLVATYDWSKWEEEIGIREVIITSSNAPDKHPDISTEEGRNTIKAQLDALERIFYARISEGRGVTTEHIAGHFGHGGTLVAQDPSAEHEDAIRAGMIDGLTTDDVQAGAEENENAPIIKDIANLQRCIDAYMDGIAAAGFLKREPLTKDEINALLAKYSPSGDKNTPAPAGKAQEKVMELSELLKANPAAAAEIDKAKAEARVAGAQEAKAELSARVDRVMPIIQSAAYPANIKTIACNALAGKAEMATFEAVVASFDATREQANSQAAQEQTAQIGAVGAEAPELATSAADKALDAELKAAVEKRNAQIRRDK